MLFASNHRTYLVKIFFALFLLGLLAYGVFEARFLILGPSITVETPENGAFVTENTVIVEGKTSNISRIALNDRPIFIDEAGRFAERLVLSEGYTIMKLTIADRFGRERQEIIHLAH